VAALEVQGRRIRFAGPVDGRSGPAPRQPGVADGIVPRVTRALAVGAGHAALMVPVTGVVTPSAPGAHAPTFSQRVASPLAMAAETVMMPFLY